MLPLIHFILTSTMLFAHLNILFLAKILPLFHEGDDDNMMKYAGKFATTNRKIHHRNPSWTTILPEHAKSRHIRHFTICSVQYALCNMQYHVLDHHPTKLQKVDIFCRLRAPLRQFRKRCLKRRFFVGLPKIDNLSSFLNT